MEGVMTDILRVHGAAILPAIVWPAELANRFEVADCDGRHRGPCPHEDWESRAAAWFAEANGWAVHRGAMPRQFGGLSSADLMPMLDHAVAFRDRDTGRLVGIVSHNYHPRPDWSALGEAVTVDRLPRSWYMRGGVDRTTAFLLRPTPFTTGHRKQDPTGTTLSHAA
jgi:hypothetical protein